MDNIISNMSTEEMYMKNNFYIDTEYGDDKNWYLYKNICYYGGCGVDGVMFKTEDEALREGIRLTLMGKRSGISYCKKCCYELDMPYFNIADGQIPRFDI